MAEIPAWRFNHDLAHGHSLQMEILPEFATITKNEVRLVPRLANGENAVHVKHRMTAGVGLLASLAIGVAFAMATSTVNHISEEQTLSERAEKTLAASLVRLASYLLDAGWSWAALAVFVGFIARARAMGALAGAVALLGATMEYYVFKSWPLWDGGGSFYLDSRVFFWGGVSLLAGPVLGVVGAYIRRPGILGLIAGLVVPVGAALQMILMPVGIGNVSVFDGSAFREGTWARWIVWATAAFGGLYVTVRYMQAQNKDSSLSRRTPLRNSE